MWRSAIIIYCLLSSCIEALVPAPGHGALKGYCKTNQDCKKKQCCVSFTKVRGKRDLSEDLKRFVEGKCVPRGKSGSTCLVRDFSSVVKDIYLHSCPCSNGLLCKGNGQITPPLGEQGTCIKECFTSADCKSSECCVSNIHPIGRRSAKLGDVKAPGKCRPLGKNGKGCLVNNGSGKPYGIVFHSCPCKKRMTCVGTGNIERPLGETGMCKRKKKPKKI